jgi:proteasome lid subunit RPN8/RPN11
MNEPAATATDGPDVTQLAPADAEPRTLERLRGSRAGDFQVVIRDDALDAIHAHGREDTAVEICGVVVGRVCRDRVGTYLHVVGAIRGSSAGQHHAQVTFTADTWEKINNEKDEKFPDDPIVGWYHTHPGFGIFLSGMDLFIQDHFFNLPQQIALVYDPLGGDEGVFVWRGGKSVREPFLVEGRGEVDWNAIARERNFDPSRPKRPRWSAWTLVIFAMSFLLAYALMRYGLPLWNRLAPQWRWYGF